MNLRRWLTPGIGIKRWILVIFAGLSLLALGVAHAIRQVSLDVPPDGAAAGLIDIVTLQFLPYALRGLVAGLVGVTLIVVGFVGLTRVVADPLPSTDPDRSLADRIVRKRVLARGPRIVAIGGGTGLASLLRGLKEHTSNLTAVVTVADDGGSSGVLREELGIPPVGDIRNCIAALADAEPLMSDLLQYRFPGGDQPAVPGLGGHPVGNVLLAAMTALEGGDFEEGVRHLNRILAVRGQVVPVTATPLVLHARRRDGSTVEGQSRIQRTTDIERVWIAPAAVEASTAALEAIGEADLIVIGPGSLYTSLLPNLLVPGVAAAIEAVRAPRLFVCNVATQEGETEGLDLSDHLEAVVAHTAPGLIDVVLANDRFDTRVPGPAQTEHVRLDWPPPTAPTPHLVLQDVIDQENGHHHDPARLADAVMAAWTAEMAARRRGGHRSARPAGRTA